MGRVALTRGLGEGGNPGRLVGGIVTEPCTWLASRFEEQRRRNASQRGGEEMRAETGWWFEEERGHQFSSTSIIRYVIAHGPLILMKHLTMIPHQFEFRRRRRCGEVDTRWQGKIPKKTSLVLITYKPPATRENKIMCDLICAHCCLSLSSSDDRLGWYRWV